MSDADNKTSSYQLGVSGASDGSALGELGLSRHESENRQRHEDFLQSTSIKVSPSKVSTNDGDKYKLDSHIADGLVGIADGIIDSFVQLSDKMFVPLESKISAKVIGIALTICVIVVVIPTLVGVNEFQWTGVLWVDVLVSGAYGLVIPYITYKTIRWFIGPAVVIALIIGSVLAISTLLLFIIYSIFT